MARRFHATPFLGTVLLVIAVWFLLVSDAAYAKTMAPKTMTTAAPKSGMTTKGPTAPKQSKAPKTPSGGDTLTPPTPVNSSSDAPSDVPSVMPSDMSSDVPSDRPSQSAISAPKPGKSKGNGTKSPTGKTVKAPGTMAPKSTSIVNIFQRNRAEDLQVSSAGSKGNSEAGSGMTTKSAAATKSPKSTQKKGATTKAIKVSTSKSTSSSQQSDRVYSATDSGAAIRAGGTMGPKVTNTMAPKSTTSNGMGSTQAPKVMQTMAPKAPTGGISIGTVPPAAVSDVPSDSPSDVPSQTPSEVPSDVPSDLPSKAPLGQAKGGGMDGTTKAPKTMSIKSPAPQASDSTKAPKVMGTTGPNFSGRVGSSSPPSDVPSDTPSAATSFLFLNRPSDVPSSAPSPKMRRRPMGGTTPAPLSATSPTPTKSRTSEPEVSAVPSAHTTASSTDGPSLGGMSMSDTPSDHPSSLPSAQQQSDMPSSTPTPLKGTMAPAAKGMAPKGPNKKSMNGSGTKAPKGAKGPDGGQMKRTFRKAILGAPIQNRIL